MSEEWWRTRDPGPLRLASLDLIAARQRFDDDPRNWPGYFHLRSVPAVRHSADANRAGSTFDLDVARYGPKMFQLWSAFAAAGFSLELLNMPSPNPPIFDQLDFGMYSWGQLQRALGATYAAETNEPAHWARQLCNGYLQKIASVTLTRLTYPDSEPKTPWVPTEVRLARTQ